jgi:hypothetical protein
MGAASIPAATQGGPPVRVASSSPLLSGFGIDTIEDPRDAADTRTHELWLPAVSPDGQWIAATRGSEFAPELVTARRLAWPTPDRRNYRIRDLGTGKDELLMNEPTVGFVAERDSLQRRSGRSFPEPTGQTWFVDGVLALASRAVPGARYDFPGWVVARRRMDLRAPAWYFDDY